MNYQPKVLFEDNHLLIVNKKAGEIVQGDKTGDKPLVDLLKQFLKDKYNKPGNVYLGLPHRLDRPTSGVLIFAKTSKALPRLTEMFKKHAIQKTYWAVIPKVGIKREQRLENFLEKNQKQNKSYVVSEKNKASKKAVLNYVKLKDLDSYSLLEINLETGRHHQIRCQLANIGAPIKGDLKYGAKRSNPDGSIHLHAREVSFIHPVSKNEMRIIAPVPESDSIWQAL